MESEANITPGMETLAWTLKDWTCFYLNWDQLFLFTERLKREYIKMRDVRMKDAIPEDYQP